MEDEKTCENCGHYSSKLRMCTESTPFEPVMCKSHDGCARWVYSSIINTELLKWMIKEVNSCKGCLQGDSGDVHCIICNKNVLSTDELKSTDWSDLRGDVTTQIDGELADAKKILSSNEALLLKYPDMFSLNFMVTQWKRIVKRLESKQ